MAITKDLDNLHLVRSHHSRSHIIFLNRGVKVQDLTLPLSVSTLVDHNHNIPKGRRNNDSTRVLALHLAQH